MIVRTRIPPDATPPHTSWCTSRFDQHGLERYLVGGGSDAIEHGAREPDGGLDHRLDVRPGAPPFVWLGSWC